MPEPAPAPRPTKKQPEGCFFVAAWRVVPVDRQAQAAACRALLFFDLAVASFFEPVLPADEACCAVCLVPDFLAPDFFAVACDLPPDFAVLPAVLPAVFPVAFPAVLCRVPD